MRDTEHNKQVLQKNYPDLHVSIIICTRNDFDSLKDTLDCIYQMSFKFFEIIVIDDASTDNTSDKAMYYFGNRSNFTLVTYTNQKGYPAARNEGILRATGHYLMFLDAGFVISEDSLTLMLDECPHYNIVYPKLTKLGTNNYKMFEKAHEKYIKFSYCFIAQKCSFYCFNGLFYDTKLEEPFCDFDFFGRSLVYNLSSFLVDGSECSPTNATNEKLIAHEKSVNTNESLQLSCKLFKAIYHDMSALKTIELILEALNNTEDLSIKNILGLSDHVEYIKKKRNDLFENNNSYLYRYRDSYFKKLSDSHFILIEITNACHHKCSGCSRAVNLLKDYQYMSLAEIEVALKSLKGWKRPVAIFGGEPTIHPDFPAICDLIAKYFPKEQRALFTCGGRQYNKYKDIIENTYGVINYNDHKTPSFHQPIFVSGYDILNDKKMCDVLISRCWVQQVFCQIITKQGAFFCEVASTIDLLHNNGKGGFELTPGWWKRDVTQWKDQIEKCCTKCGCGLPIAAVPDNSKKDVFSSSHYEKLKDKISKQHSGIEVYDKMHDTMSIFKTAKEASKENYCPRNSKSYWYKENWLDSREQEDNEYMFHQ